MIANGKLKLKSDRSRNLRLQIIREKLISFATFSVLTPAVPEPLTLPHHRKQSRLNMATWMVQTQRNWNSNPGLQDETSIAGPVAPISKDRSLLFQWSDERLRSEPSSCSTSSTSSRSWTTSRRAASSGERRSTRPWSEIKVTKGYARLPRDRWAEGEIPQASNSFCKYGFGRAGDMATGTWRH